MLDIKVSHTYIQYIESFKMKWGINLPYNNCSVVFVSKFRSY